MVRIKCCVSLGTVLFSLTVAALAPACRKSAPEEANASRAVADRTTVADPPPQRPSRGDDSDTADQAVREAAAAEAGSELRPRQDAQPAGDVHENAPERTPDGNPIDPKVRRVLGRMISAYQQAQSYEDDTEFRIIQHLHQGPLKVRFERPNKVDARIPNARIVSDGNERTVYLEDLGEHVTTDAPEQLQAERLWGETIPRDRISELGTISVPLRLMLVEDPWAYVLDGVVAVSMDAEPVEIDGREHDVIRFDKFSDDAVLYVDRQSGLMRRLEVDITARLAAMGQPVTGRVVYTLEMHNAQLDVPERPFSYEPPAGSEEVDAFDFPDPLLPPITEPDEPDAPLESSSKPEESLDP